MSKNKSPNAVRVARTRDKLRAQGLRPIQIWIPDRRAAGFAKELARQCRAEAKWAAGEGREDAAFWDQVAADAWAD